jgi:hypothetical protein
MGKYKIENTEFTFDVDDLFIDYESIQKFPIRPNKIDGLDEILFQISERREWLHDGKPLVIYETAAHQYVIENRVSNYSDDVYLNVYKIYGNGLRMTIRNNIVGIAYLEEDITRHISDYIEWDMIR